MSSDNVMHHTTNAKIMDRNEYKVIAGTTGIKDLEEKVTEALNNGWRICGGIAFNQGFPYQAMGRKTTKKR